MKSALIVPSLLTAAAMLTASAVEAACVNRYIHRKDSRGRIALTVVTGKLTFTEAQKLAADVDANKATITWTDRDGKPIVTALPGVQAQRPMPVGCDGRASGAAMAINFLRPTPPAGNIYLRFGDGEVVELEEQKN